MTHPLLKHIQRNIIHDGLHRKGVPELVRMNPDPDIVLDLLQVQVHNLPFHREQKIMRVLPDASFEKVLHVYVSEVRVHRNDSVLLPWHSCLPVPSLLKRYHPYGVCGQVDISWRYLENFINPAACT